MAPQETPGKREGVGMENMKRLLIIGFALALSGCGRGWGPTTGVEDLKPPVRVVNVVPMPQMCRATFMGNDGELYTVDSTAACAFTVNQVLETQ